MYVLCLNKLRYPINVCQLNNITYHFNDTSQGDQHPDQRLGFVSLCYNRLPEDGTPVSKHVAVLHLS
jgi:hypothetical protein